MRSNANSVSSGELEYITDMIEKPGQLFAEFVKTQAIPLSTIKSVDPSEALVPIHTHIQ